MNIDEVMDSWKVDCIIDENRLDETTLKNAILHAKYLQSYSIAKLNLKKKEYDLALLMKDKWLYYNGKMSKDDMDKLGWAYDPFKGCAKPLKSDMDIFYSTDPDLMKIKMQIDIQSTLVDALKDILDNIKWKHNAIKNILDFKKFSAGV